MIKTLCYIEQDNKYLMLHRTKKENDINRGKWLGIGGKLEKNETPEECLLREIKEETGLNALSYDFKGVVIFNYNEDEPLYMYLYICKNFSGKLIENCDEGELRWIDKNEIFNLNIWEGDKIFLELLLKDSPFFYLTLDYKDDKLINSKLEFVENNYVNFEVFVPADYVERIIVALREYSLINEGFYADVYATADVIGHWTTLEGANAFIGKVGEASIQEEKLIKFRVKKDFKELAYYLIKKAHPYESPVINML